MLNIFQLILRGLIIIVLVQEYTAKDINNFIKNEPKQYGKGKPSKLKESDTISNVPDELLRENFKQSEFKQDNPETNLEEINFQFDPENLGIWRSNQEDNKLEFHESNLKKSQEELFSYKPRINEVKLENQERNLFKTNFQSNAENRNTWRNQGENREPEFHTNNLKNTKHEVLKHKPRITEVKLVRRETNLMETNFHSTTETGPRSHLNLKHRPRSEDPEVQKVDLRVMKKELSKDNSKRSDLKLDKGAKNLTETSNHSAHGNEPMSSGNVEPEFHKVDPRKIKVIPMNLAKNSRNPKLDKGKLHLIENSFNSAHGNWPTSSRYLNPQYHKVNSRKIKEIPRNFAKNSKSSKLDKENRYLKETNFHSAHENWPMNFRNVDPEFHKANLKKTEQIPGDLAKNSRNRKLNKENKYLKETSFHSAHENWPMILGNVDSESHNVYPRKIREIPRNLAENSRNRKPVKEKFNSIETSSHSAYGNWPTSSGNEDLEFHKVNLRKIEEIPGGSLQNSKISKLKALENEEYQNLPEITEESGVFQLSNFTNIDPTLRNLELDFEKILTAKEHLKSLKDEEGQDFKYQKRFYEFIRNPFINFRQTREIFKEHVEIFETQETQRSSIVENRPNDDAKAQKVSKSLITKLQSSTNSKLDDNLQTTTAILTEFINKEDKSILCSNEHIKLNIRGTPIFKPLGNIPKISKNLGDWEYKSNAYNEEYVKLNIGNVRYFKCLENMKNISKVLGSFKPKSFRKTLQNLTWISEISQYSKQNINTSNKPKGNREYLADFLDHELQLVLTKFSRKPKGIRGYLKHFTKPKRNRRYLNHFADHQLQLVSSKFSSKYLQHSQDHQLQLQLQFFSKPKANKGYQKQQLQLVPSKFSNKLEEYLRHSPDHQLQLVPTKFFSKPEGNMEYLEHSPEHQLQFFTKPKGYIGYLKHQLQLVPSKLSFKPKEYLKHSPDHHLQLVLPKFSTIPKGNGGYLKHSPDHQLQLQLQFFTKPKGNKGFLKHQLQLVSSKFSTKPKRYLRHSPDHHLQLVPPKFSTKPKGNGGYLKHSPNHQLQYFTKPKGNGGLLKHQLLLVPPKLSTKPKGNGGYLNDSPDHQLQLVPPKFFTKPKGNIGYLNHSPHHQLPKGNIEYLKHSPDLQLQLVLPQFSTKPRANIGYLKYTPDHQLQLVPVKILKHPELLNSFELSQTTRHSKGNSKTHMKFSSHFRPKRDNFAELQRPRIWNLTSLNQNLENPPKLVKIFREGLTLKVLKSAISFGHIKTLIIFDFLDSKLKFSEIFTKQHPPLVLISASKPWQIRAKFASNFMSLVFLEKGYFPQLNNIKEILNRRQFKKIIFITEIPIFQNRKLNEELFKWLHVNGFWNSLLMDWQGNTLAFEDLTGRFKNNLTLQDFLEKEIKWPDLKGYPIKCFIGSYPPRSYIDYDDEGNLEIKGYYGTVVKLFAKYYNATLKPFVDSNLVYHNELDCGKYIAEGKVDICADALTYHTEYVITMPEEIAPSYLMVPYDKPLSRFYYFLKPFHLDVWSVVTLSFFYKVISLSFIHRLQQGSWNFSRQLLYGVLSVLFLPFQLKKVKGFYRKFLELLMILVGFVIANWYLSILSSLLFTRLYSQDIQTLKDLQQHNISIMVNEFEQYLLNATDNDPIIKQQLKVVSNEELSKHRRNLDPTYAYYSQYDRIEFYLHQQKFLLKPRMKVLTGIPPINEVLAGIPMKPNWPFQRMLNEFLRAIVESGVYLHIMEKSMVEGVLSGYLHYFPTEYYHVEDLTIEYFQMPAMLLAVGYALSLIGFIMEILVARKWKRN